MEILHYFAQKTRSYFFIFSIKCVVLLTFFGCEQKSEPSRDRKRQIKESIQRSQSDIFFSQEDPLPTENPQYPWDNRFHRK